MDAIRALLTRTCSPMTIADPEAHAQPQQDCARSTIPTLHPITHNFDRGTVLSRHDDPPLPSILPDDSDMPPAYSYLYPPPPIRGSDPSESATNRTVVGHSLRVFAIIIAVLVTVAVLVTAVILSFFNQSKV